MMITRILCPVDFSEFSRRALLHAQAIALSYHADLHVLHVVPEVVTPIVPIGGPLPMPTVSDWRPPTLSALDRFVADAGVTGPVETAVRQGQTVPEILEYADGMRADLVVTGTHGHTGLDHVMLGSTAERLVHRARCPVLTVPRSGDEAGSADRVRFTHVLCSVDFSPDAMSALQRGFSLVTGHRAKLTLVHVIEILSDEDARNQAHFRVGEYVTSRRLEALEKLRGLVPPDTHAWSDVSTVVELGSPARVILREAEARGADLIVMGAQGHSGLGLVLFGSTTQTVLRSATVPVLTARATPVDDRVAAPVVRMRTSAGA